MMVGLQLWPTAVSVVSILHSRRSPRPDIARPQLSVLPQIGIRIMPLEPPEHKAF
jgi:hypothetical protein